MYWPPTIPLTPVAVASSAAAARSLSRLGLLVGEQVAEGLRVEPVAGEDRDVLAVLDVAGGTATAEVVVVHRRQVVVDEAVGVDQLQRGGQRQQLGWTSSRASAVVSARTGWIRLPPARL